MKAESDVYIKLQNIYKRKARTDASDVLEAVRRIPGGEDIDPAEVELFCTNARFIKLINSAEGRAPNLAQVVGKHPSQHSTALPSRKISHTLYILHVSCS